jgi:hypothetical protein
MLLSNMDVTVQPHVNNLDYDLATIQLIIPNKQGLNYSQIIIQIIHTYQI